MTEKKKDFECLNTQTNKMMVNNSGAEVLISLHGEMCVCCESGVSLCVPVTNR